MQFSQTANVDFEIEMGGPLVSCINCGSVDMSRTDVRTAFWHGDRLVVVDGISALVCQTCGEQYYDDQTVVQLDLLRGAGFPIEQAEAEIVVPVFSLRNRQATDRDETVASDRVAAEPAE
jgi:YgiT-type zinc finger domain-containing protein